MECGGGERDQKKKRAGYSGLVPVNLAESRMRGRVTLEGAAGSRVVGKDGDAGSSGNEEKSLQEEKELALCHPVRVQPLPKCGYSVLVMWLRKDVLWV